MMTHVGPKAALGRSNVGLTTAEVGAGGTPSERRADEGTCRMDPRCVS